MSARAAVAAALLALLLGAAGCGSDDPGGPGGSGAEIPSVDLPDEDDFAEAPEECHEPFPLAMGTPDLDSVDLMPGDWPQPVDDALLCSTSATIGDGQQNADFATSLAPEQVLDAYESALDGMAGYELVREEPPGLGHELIAGATGDLGFQIDPQEGGFTVTFIAPGN